jgi:hypothetical protein
LFATRIHRRHLVTIGVTADNVAVGVGRCSVRLRRIELRIASACARRRVIKRAVNVVARHSRRTARRPRQAYRVDRRCDRRTRQTHAGWRVAGIAGKRSRGRRRPARCWSERHGISRARSCRNRYWERQSADHKLRAHYTHSGNRNARSRRRQLSRRRSAGPDRHVSRNRNSWGNRSQSASRRRYRRAA